jgi:hypothetical protein
MRPISFVILAVFCLSAASLYADEAEKTLKRIAKLVYEEGFLINAGEEDLLRVEIISPFYRYLGNIQKGRKINISDIKTKFTVQYTIKQWIGEYETMKETFTPVFNNQGPDVGLEVICSLDKDTLTVKVTSNEKISGVFIEILSDIPIKISNDRIRYILSAVGVSGQSLQKGPEAGFKLYLISDLAYYKVPVQITYIFQGSVYDRVFFFSFRKEDFNNEPTAH